MANGEVPIARGRPQAGPPASPAGWTRTGAVPEPVRPPGASSTENLLFAQRPAPTQPSLRWNLPDPCGPEIRPVKVAERPLPLQDPFTEPPPLTEPEKPSKLILGLSRQASRKMMWSAYGCRDQAGDHRETASERGPATMRICHVGKSPRAPKCSFATMAKLPPKAAVRPERYGGGSVGLSHMMPRRKVGQT